MDAVIDFWVATDQVHEQDAFLRKRLRAREPGFTRMMPEVKGQHQLIGGGV